MAITADDFIKASREAKDAIIESAKAAGPIYQGQKPTPLIWYDQFFGRALTPTGTLDIANFVPLRVGTTQSAIDLVIVASHANSGTLLCPAGSSVTVELFESDTEAGTYTTSGTKVTVTNAEVQNVEPDRQVYRLYVGNMKKAWMVPKITFTGAFAGGTVDVGLAYNPR